MRQAGRSQPEYRKIKEKYSLFEITHNPELCAYVTKLPADQYNVDAAILYKDIMSPLPAIGVDVEIKSVEAAHENAKAFLRINAETSRNLVCSPKVKNT